LKTRPALRLAPAFWSAAVLRRFFDWEKPRKCIGSSRHARATSIISSTVKKGFAARRFVPKKISRAAILQILNSIAFHQSLVAQLRGIQEQSIERIFG